jgi:hypothetical protein
MKEAGWLEQEPGLGAMQRDLRRVFRRALTRPGAVAVLTVIAAAGIFVWRLAKKPHYRTTVVFRITESDLDAETAPRLNRKLRDHVNRVALARSRLLKIILARGLYPSAMQRSPEDAIDHMLDDIEVEVWRNDFEEERGWGDPARSARVSISYEGLDRQVAYDVVHDLVGLIIEEQSETRVAQADEAFAAGQLALEQLRRKVEAREVELRWTRRHMEIAAPAEAGILSHRIASEQEAQARQEHELRWLEQRQAALAVRRALERQRMGMRFDVIDNGRLAPPGLTGGARVAALGLLGLLAGFALALLAIGVFDDHILLAGDLRRAGLEPLGGVRLIGALDKNLTRKMKFSSDGHR